MPQYCKLEQEAVSKPNFIAIWRGPFWSPMSPTDSQCSSLGKGTPFHNIFLGFAMPCKTRTSTEAGGVDPAVSAQCVGRNTEISFHVLNGFAGSQGCHEHSDGCWQRVPRNRDGSRASPPSLIPIPPPSTVTHHQVPMVSSWGVLCPLPTSALSVTSHG